MSMNRDIRQVKDGSPLTLHGTVRDCKGERCRPCGGFGVCCCGTCAAIGMDKRYVVVIVRDAEIILRNISVTKRSRRNSAGVVLVIPADAVEQQRNRCKVCVRGFSEKQCATVL